MRIFVVTLIGLLLISCQSNHLAPQDDESSQDGHRFTITHQADSKSRGRIAHKRRLPSQSTHTVQDGAPSGPLPSFFRKIIPKREPISRYGNPDTYQVMGKRYQVMTNSTGYKSRGIASWYGTKFHTGRTSSGEKYDMYALTAAHKTLPLPSYIRVKNLTNGKVAIVRVNDRGPFHESRILDLSYAAAAKLGLFPKGTAMVEIEALKTTQKSLHYYIQAGAFSSPQLADNLRVKLGKLTTSPVYVQKQQRTYLVQVGPFATKSMVDRLKQRLQNNGIRGSFSMLM